MGISDTLNRADIPFGVVQRRLVRAHKGLAEIQRRKGHIECTVFVLQARRPGTLCIYIFTVLHVVGICMCAVKSVHTDVNSVYRIGDNLPVYQIVRFQNRKRRNVTDTGRYHVVGRSHLDRAYIRIIGKNYRIAVVAVALVGCVRKSGAQRCCEHHTYRQEYAQQFLDSAGLSVTRSFHSYFPLFTFFLPKSSLKVPGPIRKVQRYSAHFKPRSVPFTPPVSGKKALFPQFLASRPPERPSQENV